MKYKLYENDCLKCQYHDYEFDIDDGLGGMEYEICTKGLKIYPKECKHFQLHRLLQEGTTK